MREFGSLSATVTGVQKHCLLKLQRDASSSVEFDYKKFHYLAAEGGESKLELHYAMVCIVNCNS